MSAGQTIHQLVHTLSYGDAISGEVLGLQRCFRKQGIESTIYAINVHPKLKGLAEDYHSLDPATTGEVILHYSLGSPLNQVYAQLANARRALIFHNITPAFWFSGVNPRIVDDIQSGIGELPALARLSNRLIADSKFNARELKDIGLEAEVLELPVDPERWTAAPPNPGIANMLRKQPTLDVVHVGRLAPNKKVEDIIKVFHFLHRYIKKESRLWLVGIDIDTELYSFALKRLVRDLDLIESVHFVGCLADSEVRALYENASVYLCMSEHEGFCLPIVEAMHFGLPVVAYASSAVPDTVGDGGILVSAKRHPEIAELVYQLHADPAFRERIVSAGKRRVQELSFDRFERRVMEMFSVAKGGTARERRYQGAEV